MLVVHRLVRGVVEQVAESVEAALGVVIDANPQGGMQCGYRNDEDANDWEKAFGV